MLTFSYPLLLDGATGTALQKAGMPTGVCTEQWVLDHSQPLIALQRAYAAAGSKVVYAPTFGANRALLRRYRIDADAASYVRRLVALSREAVGGRAIIAGDMTTTGSSFTDEAEETLDIYREQVQALRDAGVELTVGETMLSLAEGRACLRAIKEAGMTAFISFTVDRKGRTLAGEPVLRCLQEMEAGGADAVGINCASGIDRLLPLLTEAVPLLHTPVLVKANATRYRDGQAVGTLPPAEYAGYVRRLRDAGVSVFGGCCGTTPAHIAAMRAVLDEKKP